MTYVNTLQERKVFAALRSWLVARRLSLRAIYWITGLMAFLLSPILDNLTTALVHGRSGVERRSRQPAFPGAGLHQHRRGRQCRGRIQPFGDITTLMVWQKGMVRFFEFFDLFLPSLVNWLVPALCMHFAVPRAQPEPEAGTSRR